MFLETLSHPTEYFVVSGPVPAGPDWQEGGKTYMRRQCSLQISTSVRGKLIKYFLNGMKGGLTNLEDIERRQSYLTGACCQVSQRCPLNFVGKERDEQHTHANVTLENKCTDAQRCRKAVANECASQRESIESGCELLSRHLTRFRCEFDLCNLKITMDSREPRKTNDWTPRRTATFVDTEFVSVYAQQDTNYLGKMQEII